MAPERSRSIPWAARLPWSGPAPTLADTRRKMNDAGIEVSLFVSPVPAQVEAAARVGAQFIELNTGSFAENFHRKHQRAQELDTLAAAAVQAHALGLGVNAGHGLNYQNLPALLPVPHLVELNIGHCIISRALVVGLPTAVREMLLVMQGTPRPASEP